MRRRNRSVTPYGIKEKSSWWWRTASGPHVDYNARLYDPALGRFLSVDPLIGHPESTQGINPYSYVENNPLNATDPTGEVMTEWQSQEVMSMPTGMAINELSAEVSDLQKSGVISNNEALAGQSVLHQAAPTGTTGANSTNGTNVSAHMINNDGTGPFPSETASGADVSGKAASVPDKIKLEASGYKTSKAAAEAVKDKYAATSMKNHQELETAIVHMGKDNWGYLTPGWGPSGIREVDTTALVNAYQNAGYATGIWIHSHFDSMLNFSATDFGLVWTDKAPKRGETGTITYMINSHLELRELTDAYLHEKFNALDFQQQRLELEGLQQTYWEDGLPGVRP